MFDLNLSIGSNFEEDESPVTTASWVVNGEEGSSYNGTWSTRASPENSYTLNFGILNRNDRVEKDRYLTESDPVTRELFPVSGLCELNMGRPHNNGNGNCIDQRVVPRKLAQHVKPKKSRRGPPSRSSQYRGVTFYRRTGRWESHIWDCGKQIYLGGFDTALAAARAYDRAAIKFRGVDADINFNLSDYEDEINQMKSLSKEEFVHILRRRCTRGSSKYRGVTLHKCGQWEARMEQLHGKKAYDKAAIERNGRDAVTNFESTKYDVSEPRNEGSQHDLDLNLGISSSSPKENERVALLQFQPYEVQNARKSKLQLDPPLKGLPLTSEYPTSSERLAENRIEVSQGQPNWGRQVDGRATPMAMFSAAASSGFSSLATTALSASALSRKLPSQLPGISAFVHHIPQLSADISQYPQSLSLVEM